MDLDLFYCHHATAMSKWKEPFDAAVKEYRRGDYEKSLELLDRVGVDCCLVSPLTPSRR